MASGPTYEGARLLLQLYDLRREKVLRRARDFVNRELKFKDVKDFNKRYPEGSKGAQHVGKVVGYWDLACALVDRRLIDEELFNSVTWEHVGVWNKLKPVVLSWRKQFNAPEILKSLEQVASRHPAAAPAAEREDGAKNRKKSTRGR